MKIVIALILLIGCQGHLRSETLKIAGSTTVAPVVELAAEVLRKQHGMTIFVDTQGGSSGGIQALGSGLTDLAMSSKRLTAADRDKFPNTKFIEHQIGEDAVALVVGRDVFEGGVRKISREQIKDIYEGRITNWKSLGGPDMKIVFFNKEPGRGTWEVFAQWVYGKASNAPPVNHPEVGANQEVLTKVSRTRGAISQLSSSWVDAASVHALEIEDANGSLIAPTPANIASQTYPLSRPLFVISDGDPQGLSKIMIEFLLGESGQELVRKQGYLANKDLEKSP